MKRELENIKEEIKSMLPYYKKKGVTLKNIASKFGVSERWVWQILSREYGDEYRKISKFKSYEHTLKIINKNKIFNAFKSIKMEQVPKNLQRN